MDYPAQYASFLPQPAYQLQPPTPSEPSHDAIQTTFTISASTSPMPVPIPMSRSSSGAGTPASSLSRSVNRHHPYSASPASFNSSYPDHRVRLRSATSASDRSDRESETGACETDFDPRHIYGSTDSISPCDWPTTSSSYFSAPSPFVGDGVARVGKNEKPGKSHARRTAPGHIKRPPNAFILFRSHCCSPAVDSSQPEPPGTAHARHLASLEINNSQHISVIVSQVWKGLSKEDKAYWEQKAQEAKEEHQRLHPDYRYRPQQRPKETIRKRKKADPIESKEHREACNEVARQVLEIERANSGRSRETSAEPMSTGDDLQFFVPPASGANDQRWTMGSGPGEGAGARPSTAKAKATLKAKTKRVRKPKAKATSPAEPTFVVELPERNIANLAVPPLVSPDAFVHRPHTAPPNETLFAPEVYADFSPAPGFNAFGRRTSHTRTQRFGQQDYSSQFAFMQQLEQVVPQTFAIDPQLGLLDPTVDISPAPLSRPVTSASDHSSSAHLDPSCNPGMSYFSAPSSVHPHTTPTLTMPLPDFPSRPVSSTTDAIQQMQCYSLGNPSPPAASPPQVHTIPPHQTAAPASTVTSFTFGSVASNLPKSVAPLAQRRAGNAPLPLPLTALKRERSTIRPGEIGSMGRGDLMLISPMTATFNGRKHSTDMWSPGLRRLSRSQPGAEVDENVQAPPRAFRRSSLSTGVLSANETFETFTFPQELLESLPVEDPYAAADFLAQLNPTILSTPEEDYDQSRPTTATSEWSTDDGMDQIERLEGGFPAGYFERRRSTIVASKFIGSIAEQSYHVGSTDFFGAPQSVFSSSATSALVEQQPPMPAFGSPEFGGSFQPCAHRRFLDAVLADSNPFTYARPPPVAPSTSPSTDVHASVAHENDWRSEDDGAVEPTASSMRKTALAVLQERRQHEHQQHSSPMVQQQSPQPECEYVYLTLDQLGDAELMAKIHRHGYGIAFEAAPLTADSTAGHYELPSVLTDPSLDSSPPTAYSATF
ncbi:hypothetical protein JCM5296_003052 [Sporobolomyces johnsonii]